MLMGIDIGLTMVKAGIFTLNGETLAIEERRTSLVFAENGFVEKDMDELWEAVSLLVQETLLKHEIPTSEIQGIGLSAYGDGVITLDHDKNVIGNGITSIDTRAKNTWNTHVSQDRHEELYQIIKQQPFLGSPLPILHWMYTYDRERYEKTEYVIFAKDYIRYQLTGEIQLDITDASSGLINNITRRKDERIEKILRIPQVMDKIPDIVKSYQVTGNISKKAEALTGLKAGTPVVAGLHDVASTAVGSGCVNHGDSFIILGTWGITAMCSNSPQDHSRGNWFLRCLPEEDKWLMLQASPSAGSNIDWLLKSVSQLQHETTELHKKLNGFLDDIPLGSLGLRYLPYLHGQKVENKTLNALFYGISFEHDLKHLYRAMLEGILFDRIKVLSQFQSRINFSPSVITIQGGGSRNETWMQMFADATNKPIRVLQSSQAGVRGAAIVAGVGVGVFQSVKEGVEIIRDDEIFYEPNLQYFQQYQELQGEYQELLTTLI
jgi:L-xylulokinase